MESPAERLRQRAERAKARRLPWDGELRDGYRYAAPLLDDWEGWAGGVSAEGNRRTEHLYDSTALDAVMDAARLTQSVLAPETSAILSLDHTDEAWRAIDALGPEARRTATVFLGRMESWVTDGLRRSNFGTQLHLCCQQVQISSGCLLFDEDTGSRSISPFRFQTVPLSQVFPEPCGDPRRQSNWRYRELAAEAVIDKYPGAADLECVRQAENKTLPKLKLWEGALYERETVDYRVVAIVKDSDRWVMLRDTRERTSPLSVFGLMQSPGEGLHRGPVLAVMPDIRAVNKTVELVLKNAALAVTGVFQADDDGVLNPATVQITPGAIIPKAVGSKGLQPLGPASDFNVADMVLGDLRRRIRYGIVGRELPNERKSHVSATADQQDWQEMSLLRLPSYQILWTELMTWLALRAVDIGLRRGDLRWLPFEDLQASLKLAPSSPLMRLAARSEADQAFTALARLAQLAPSHAQALAGRPETLAWFLSHDGFPASLMPDPEEMAAITQAIEQQQQGQQMISQAAEAAPAIDAAVNAARMEQ